MSPDDAVSTLWETLVERAEQLNDTIVLGQRRAVARDAGQVAALAQEMAHLALAAQILRRRVGKRS